MLRLDWCFDNFLDVLLKPMSIKNSHQTMTPPPLTELDLPHQESSVARGRKRGEHNDQLPSDQDLRRKRQKFEHFSSHAFLLQYEMFAKVKN